LKIIHATEIDIGGTATVINLLMQSQVVDGKISLSKCVAPERISDALDSNLMQHITTFKRTGRNPKSLVYFAIALTKAIWKDDPDIVHLHSTFAGIIGRLMLILLKPFRNPKVVYCPHGFSFLMEGSALKRKLFSRLEILLSYATTQIICVSYYEKKAAIQAGISSDKLTVVYNGTPPVKIQKKNHSSPYTAQANSINYLFAGRFDRAKGFDILLSAIPKIKSDNIHFTVAGISADEVPAEARLPNITYLGWMNSNDLTPYFAHADALVLPSRWEGFPMVVLEAMSMGVSVIASNCTSLSEAVDHQVTGLLFSTANAEELSDAISNTSIHSLREMGSNGFIRFNEKFTSTLMTSSTLNLYSELLKNHSKDKI